MKIHRPTWSIDKQILWLLVDEEYARHVGLVGNKYRDDWYGIPVARYENNTFIHYYSHIEPTKDELYAWELEASLHGEG
jgi:hypothetical protein